MRSERRIELISTENSNKNHYKFHEIFNIVARIKYIDDYMNKICTNGINIINSISLINSKYSKMIRKLNKNQLKNLMPSILKSIKEIPYGEMNTNSLNKAFNLNLINQESPSSSPHGSHRESNGRHWSITPSKFNRNSEEERNNLLRQLEKLDASQQLNYVSSIRKVNNFIDSEGSRTPKIVQNFNRSNNGKSRVNSEKFKTIVEQQSCEEIEKRIYQKRQFLLEKRRKNEERSATLIETCKSSENRLLSSLSRRIEKNN